MGRAKRLTVLIVENGSSVSALACESDQACGVGSGSSTERAVSSAVGALESGKTVSKSEARAILDRADDVWSEEFRRQALRGVGRSRVARRRRSR